MKHTPANSTSRFRSAGMRREVLAGVAVAASALSAATAQADVVYSGLVNLPLETVAGKDGKGVPPGHPGIDVAGLPGGAGFYIAAIGVASKSSGAASFGAIIRETRPGVQFIGGSVLSALAQDTLIDAAASFGAGPRIR